ncbi:hypothetical protein CRV03_02515 [Arcobacter sp. F155]|uniref:hypothetical protein n=1 Tax=Arcobacter sp. F155 TaxID=2044512 RepID=UPI00100A8CEB|nr:hypothetical protein [Arcobacter sp. F155]RXJ77863.1 hypothetical protein CRV03_02515 [Arcobacter sp. F155]
MNYNENSSTINETIYMNWVCPHCNIKAIVLKNNFDFTCSECGFKEINDYIDHSIYLKEEFRNYDTLIKLDRDFKLIKESSELNPDEYDLTFLFGKMNPIKKLIVNINDFNKKALDTKSKNIIMVFNIQKKKSLLDLNNYIKVLTENTFRDYNPIIGVIDNETEDDKLILYYQ